MIAARREQLMLTKRDDGNWRAVVRQIPMGLVLLASAEKHTELVLDSLWNIESWK